ncbi:uncharacterized protein ELE39_001481 [Cryptosporidium sp. chipmunk genotype I]|uniref:uncharacterized protein n=1 Tax=Cryptosporidium sp. chipmunk genotype I TaxID=1280935 RepID=UPI00351A0D48|nr:hypothetical protein ELE39_001481 [Cryptosporidium sp. chipmunk genotype I]
MKSYAIPCKIEVKEDLKDGISLISKEMMNKLTDNLADTEYDRIHLVELNFESLENSKFLILFKTYDDIDICKKDIVYIHSGLSSIRHLNKGYIKYIKHEKFPNVVNKTISLDIVFSGPLFVQLSTQSDVFLLNYRNLLVEALRRQLYCYLKPNLTEYHLKDTLSNAILPFLINEKYYFFQIQHVKENNLASEEFQNLHMNFISNLLIIPNINQLNSIANNNNNKSKNLEIESFLVKNINDIKNILNNNNNATSIFYLDTTYILNKYVIENNVSIRILKNIKNNIIERIKDILQEITIFNNLNSDKIISINIFLYNYITSFSNLSIQGSLITQLEEYFFRFTCIKKLTLMEYKDSQNSESLNCFNRSNIFSKTSFYNTRHLKCLIMTRNYFHMTGAQSPHANGKLLSVLQIENEVEKKKEDIKLNEEELLFRYFKLKKELNEYVSILLLDKNFDVFLELMYYQNLNKLSMQQLEDLSGNRDVIIGIDIVNWIIRVCFGISDKQLVYKVVEILFRNLVIGNLLYNSYLEDKKMLLCKTTEGSDGKNFAFNNQDFSFKDESIKLIIQQVNDQLIIYKIFENEYSKINQLINQQFTPRILIYGNKDNLNGSKLSVVKQELIKYIQKHYINYKFVHKHILSLLSPYVGQSEENIRQLFNTNIPTILILEGIDLISSNFIINSKQTGAHSFQDKINFSLTNNSNLTNSNPNFFNYSPDLFNNISFRINLHKERIKNMFNTSWTSHNLAQTNRCLENDQTDDQSPSKNSNDSRTLLTTLLLCLDNVEKKNQNVIVIALSNKHILELDESITRAGRLDIHIPV